MAVIEEKRRACEAVLGDYADKASYEDYIKCGYIETRAIKEIKEKPEGLVFITAEPGYGKTALGKIVEAMCINEKRCVPVYIQLRREHRDNIYSVLEREFAQTFALRGQSVLRPFVGDFVDRWLKDGPMRFLECTGALHCISHRLKYADSLPKALLVIDELTAPFAQGAIPSLEELKVAIETLDPFLRKVQNDYCGIVGGLILMGHWGREEDTLRYLSTGGFGGLDRVFGRTGVRVYTERDLVAPDGHIAEEFAKSVVSIFDVNVDISAFKAYSVLAQETPLRLANKFLYYLVHGVLHSHESLSDLSHAVENALAEALGGTPRWRGRGTECDVYIPKLGLCVEIKVRGQFDSSDFTRLSTEIARREIPSFLVYISPNCPHQVVKSQSLCIEVVGLDRIMSSIYMVSRDVRAAYVAKRATEEVAKSIADRIKAALSEVAETPKQVQRISCDVVKKLYDLDCKNLHGASKSEWVRHSELIRLLNGGKRPRKVDEIEEIIRQWNMELEKCGVVLAVVRNYIWCKKWERG